MPTSLCGREPSSNPLNSIYPNDAPEYRGYSGAFCHQCTELKLRRRRDGKSTEKGEDFDLQFPLCAASRFCGVSSACRAEEGQGNSGKRMDRGMFGTIPLPRFLCPTNGGGGIGRGSRGGSVTRRNRERLCSMPPLASGDFGQSIEPSLLRNSPFLRAGVSVRQTLLSVNDRIAHEKHEGGWMCCNPENPSADLAIRAGYRTTPSVGELDLVPSNRAPGKSHLAEPRFERIRLWNRV